MYNLYSGSAIIEHNNTSRLLSVSLQTSFDRKTELVAQKFSDFNGH